MLVVEDERVIAMDLQQTLARMGYDAYAIAASADEAIEKAARRGPDLVLMDIRIRGDRDGIEAAKIFREQFQAPVIFLTAYVDDETVRRAKLSEPYAYLVKPVDPAELRSAIEITLYRHEMEKRARERERWFSTTLHSIGEAVIAVDLAGVVTFLNPTAEALIGVPSARVLGRPAAEVLRVLEHGHAVHLPLLTALESRQPVTMPEAALVNVATGVETEIADSAAPVVDSGRLLGAVMVFRDTTEEKKRQRQLELAERLASLGTLAAGVAHEVNGPLTVAMACTGVALRAVRELRERFDAGEDMSARMAPMLTLLTKWLTDVDAANMHVSRIVGDLRTFSRTDPPDAQQSDVAAVLDWALRVTAGEIKHRARLVTRLEPVPLVEGDYVRLGQVIVNLVVNACQAIEPGNATSHEIAITLTQLRPDRVLLEVRDDGAGIPRDVLPHVFEPFYTTKGSGGTGLGLAICHGIVTAIGGEISVESEPGKGTVFRLVLRVAQGSEEDRAQSELPPAERARVLVIDDEEPMLRAIDAVLGGQHELVLTRSAKNALERIEAGERFDAIVSDVMMPTMTGAQFFERLLEAHPEMARRVLFITGGATTPEIDDFLRSIPNERIEKPFEERAFVRRLHAVINAGRGG